jgi:hypothetical protein
MISRSRVIQVATTVSFIALVTMSLVIEALKFDVETHTELYLGFFALGGVSLVLAWFVFADVRR